MCSNCYSSTLPSALLLRRIFAATQTHLSCQANVSAASLSGLEHHTSAIMSQKDATHASGYAFLVRACSYMMRPAHWALMKVPGTELSLTVSENGHMA